MIIILWYHTLYNTIVDQLIMKIWLNYHQVVNFHCMDPFELIALLWKLKLINSFITYSLSKQWINDRHDRSSSACSPILKIVVTIINGSGVILVAKKKGYFDIKMYKLLTWPLCTTEYLILIVWRIKITLINIIRVIMY